MGQRLAEWARGSGPANEFDVLVADYARCPDMATFEKLEARRGELWKKPSPLKPRLKDASDATRKRLEEMSKGNADDPKDWLRTFAAQQSSAALDKIWSECADAYADKVPLDIDNAYRDAREALVEREAKEQL
jgi:hypothetical protein